MALRLPHPWVALKSSLSILNALAIYIFLIQALLEEAESGGAGGNSAMDGEGAPKRQEDGSDSERRSLDLNVNV